MREILRKSQPIYLGSKKLRPRSLAWWTFMTIIPAMDLIILALLIDLILLG